MVNKDGRKIKLKRKLWELKYYPEILSSIISVFSTNVAKIAAKIPAKPIFEPISKHANNIAKDPSQALIL
ncbi:MAG: hypothetical protein COY72_00300, partial [Candidatus Nealsonbacteria bacterium CG_4_10_14_0_8_um_filter_35_10]